MSVLKPPFPYFGGKQRVASAIISHFPDHAQYVEPFAGGLSILMAKEPARAEVINDLDQDIMTFWRVLRDRGDDLERACALTPHSRAEATLSRERDVDDDIERARRVWVALTQRRGGQLRPTGFRYTVKPTGNSLSLIGYLNGYMRRFAPAIERLRGVTLECPPALDVIEKYGAFEETLLYVDPPYLGETRGGTNAYQHEMKNASEHADLAKALNDAKASVVLSGYRSPLYEDLYRSWDCVEISASTSQGGTSTSRQEVLWINRTADRGRIAA